MPYTSFFPPDERPQGRPRLYTEELAYEFCERVGSGKAVHTVCLADDMPSATTVYRWLDKIPEFREVFKYALLAKFDKRAEECIEIADAGDRDFEIVATSEEGALKAKVNGEAIERTKLRLGERHRHMAKELPLKYADFAPQQAPSPVFNLSVGGIATSGDNAKVIDGNVLELTADPVLRAIAGYVAEEAAQK